MGQTITISGASPSAYDGTFTVASIISSTEFTYTMSSTPSSNASGSYMMVAAQSLDNVISRVDGLQDKSSGTVLEGYTYLGLSTIVQESHPETGIDLTYIDQSGVNAPTTNSPGGDQYTGLDQFGRVIDQYYANLSSPSSPTDDFEYAYDEDGNVLYSDVVDQGSTAADFSQLYHANGAAENSSYDSLNRLTDFAQGTLSASGTNGSELDTISSATTTQSWSLDAQDNWNSVTTNSSTQTRSYNSQNQLTGVSSATTPTYDNNGNMTEDQNGTIYTYDAWNRMVKANFTGGVEIFGYLAGGQRASTTVSGSTESYSFFSSQWQDIEDATAGASGSAVMQDTYVWGMANVNELVERTDASGNRLYVQQNAVWSVTALVGEVSGTWQVVERFTYTPYGVATVLTASWGSTTDSYNWVFRYQGGRYDSLTGLYNFRNRDYSPTLGQWIEADPAGYVQGANLYEANLGSPISHIDPYGMTAGTGSSGDGNDVFPTGVTNGPTTQPTTQPTMPPITVIFIHVPQGQPFPTNLPPLGPNTIRVIDEVDPQPTPPAPGTPKSPNAPGAPASQPATPSNTNNDDAALFDAAFELGLEMGLDYADAYDEALNSTLVTDASGNTIIVPPDVIDNVFGSPTVYQDPLDGLYHAVLWNGDNVTLPWFPPLPTIKVTTPATNPSSNAGG